MRRSCCHGGRSCGTLKDAGGRGDLIAVEIVGIVEVETQRWWCTVGSSKRGDGRWRRVKEVDMSARVGRAVWREDGPLVGRRTCRPGLTDGEALRHRWRGAGVGDAGGSRSMGVEVDAHSQVLERWRRERQDRGDEGAGQCGAAERVREDGRWVR